MCHDELIRRMVRSGKEFQQIHHSWEEKKKMSETVAVGSLVSVRTSDSRARKKRPLFDLHYQYCLYYSDGDNGKD